jgi:L-lactate utilization protein LutC
MDWTKLADDETVEKTVKALKENGFEVIIADNGEDAMRKTLGLIPKGAEVLAATSATTSAIGLASELDESGKYNSVRKKLMSMDRNKEHMQMSKIGSAPEWIVGSVHAVTEDGKVMIVSASGSQLPGYSYGSQHVIWVVGTQKIVKDLDQGFKRIYEHVLPLEDERVKKVYHIPGSSVSKVLIMQKERPGRITIVLVKEALGF